MWIEPLRGQQQGLCSQILYSRNWMNEKTWEHQRTCWWVSYLSLQWDEWNTEKLNFTKIKIPKWPAHSFESVAVVRKLPPTVQTGSYFQDAGMTLWSINWCASSQYSPCTHFPWYITLIVPIQKMLVLSIWTCHEEYYKKLKEKCFFFFPLQRNVSSKSHPNWKAICNWYCLKWENSFASMKCHWCCGLKGNAIGS